MRRDLAEELLLVDAHAQGGKDFKIELAKGSEAQQRDGLIEHGAPAQDAHDNLGNKMAIDGGKLVEKWGMQKLHSVGRLALHAQQNVECGVARWRDSHGQPSRSPAAG